MSQYLAVAIVEKRLNVTSAAMYRLIQGGQIASIDFGFGRATRAHEESLEKFAENRRKGE